MAVSVTIFNASSLNLLATANQGPRFSLPATGPQFKWAPYPAPSGAPSYQPGFPQPNVIGNTGVNTMQAYVDGVPIGAAPFQFSIPERTPVGSLQVYFFFATVHSVSWIALIDGKPFAEQVVTTFDHFSDRSAHERTHSRHT